MPSLLKAKSGKKHHSQLVIDYTNPSTPIFNEKIKRKILKHKEVFIIDNIFPFVSMKAGEYEVKDHLNLSGENPLKGPQFISMTDVYQSRSGIIVAGLKQGVVPNDLEANKLKKAGVKAYCYNIVPTVIFSIANGLKVRAKGVVAL